MNVTLFSRLRRARWVHVLQLFVFTCWVANPFPGALSYWTDSNSDGVKEEVANPAEGDSWWDQDSDGDNLTNAQEALYGSDPYSIDSDHDGLRDDAEQQLSDPTAPFDPWLWDSNGNGFSDHDELYQRLQGYTPVVNYTTLAAGSFFSYSDADGDDLKNHEDSDPLNMDRDNDGVLNWNDTGYMDDPNNGYTPPPENNDPGVWIGGNWYPTGTMDSDGDGTPDQYDSFPYGSYWYNGMEFGGSWSDRDNDGIPDTADSYPDGSHWYNGVEYSGTMVDQDGDGVPDWADPWPSVAGSYWYNGSEYPGAWNDQDGDGIPDPADPSPNGSYWWNGTEYLGAWVDQDGDGTPDPFDAFPTTAGSYWWNGTEYGGSWADADNDGTPDAFDATPNGGYWYNGTEYAGTWSDVDNDGVPDAADATPNGSYWYNGTEYAGTWSDVDNDGVPDAADFWMWDPWNGAPHFNYNGTEYAGDWIDRDNDTIPDAADAWPDDAENNADNDGDGLSNYAENTQHGTDPGNVDSDGEGLTDFEELYTYHTNPLAEKTSPNQVYTDFYIVDQTDSDGDQIPDRIEQWYAGQGYGMSANDANDALGDLDGDGYSNREAYFNGWNFTAHLNQYDNDADGILDVLEDTWNVSYPGILSSANFGDAVEDYDNDGLMNFEEVALGLNPGNASSRITGVSDLQEWAWRGIIYQTGVIAFSGSVPPEWNVVNDADNTHAPDGLESFVAALNANPALVALPQRVAGGDYDGDGMPDVWEHQYHLNLRDAADAEANNDGDSLTNLQEFTSNPPRDPLINDDPPPPELTLAADVPNGAVGEAYTATFTASGGTGTYTYSLTNGTLPDGLSFDSTTGVVSGTPTMAGTCDLWVQVSDSAGQTASTSYGLIIAGLQFVTETLPQGTVGADYTASISVAQGIAPYTFLLITQPGENGLPFGYTLQSNGTLTGIGDISTGSQQAGTYTFTVQVNDNAGQMAERQFTLELNPVSVPPLSITTTALPPVGVGLPYAFTLQAAGGSEVEFSAEGLPAGMTLSSGGSLSGTMIESGSHLVTVTAQDHSGPEGGTRTCSATLTLQAALPQFTPTSGDEQLVPVGATVELSVRVTVAGVPQPWIMINLGSTLVMTDIQGVASANVTAPLQQGEFHVQAGFAGASFAEFSLYAYDMPPGPNPVPIDPIPGPPDNPPITQVEDDEIIVESRWVSVSKGTLEASYSSGQAIGRVNGQWQVYQEDASGYPNISRTKGQWKTSDGQSGTGDEPPALDSLPWESGLAEGLHHHYQDTESGPVSLEDEDIGNTGGGSPWPEWTNGPGVIKYNGSWNGRSVDREKRVVAEVRIKRKSVGGSGGSSGASTEKKRAFLRLIYEKPENGVETLVSSEVVYQTINPDGTVSNPPTKLNPEADKGKVRREVLVPIEIMQHPVTATSGADAPPTSSGPIRFCRWLDAYTNGVRDDDFADKDRDRFQIRIPSVIPNLTKMTIKATDLHGAVIAGGFQNKTTDGDYEVDMKQVNGAMVSEPILLVSDGDDDVTFNGKGTDNGKNDQTLLADFGSKIIVTFPELGNAEATFQAQQPIGTITLGMMYCHPKASGAPPVNMPEDMIPLMERQTQKMREIYRQIGIKVDGLSVVLITFPEDWLYEEGDEDPAGNLNGWETDALMALVESNSSPSKRIRVGFVNAALTDSSNGNSIGGRAKAIGSDPCLVSIDAIGRVSYNILAHETGHASTLRHNYPSMNHRLMRESAESYWSNDSNAAKRFMWDDADYIKANSPYYVPAQ